ncbi:hypothetical protein [Paenibacillus polymyxa]|uniref:hypothetical protein n=1 Tax=Paenibacillus polymyxa TaxID=1406 RepID=UPI002378283E|nr:hypothetical protein [Paenibacillus polymyxa]WDM21258.1 hypothetical protein J4I02_20170 [Paenibacillus polymyxa]WDM21294.1 hypothetical protein J4I02_20370 [Paenibacillus polymyxa]
MPEKEPGKCLSKTVSAYPKSLDLAGFLLDNLFGIWMKNPCCDALRDEKKTGTMVGAIVNQFPVLGGLGTVNFS